MRGLFTIPLLGQRIGGLTSDHPSWFPASFPARNSNRLFSKKSSKISCHPVGCGLYCWSNRGNISKCLGLWIFVQHGAQRGNVLGLFATRSIRASDHVGVPRVVKEDSHAFRVQARHTGHHYKRFWFGSCHGASWLGQDPPGRETQDR